MEYWWLFHKVEKIRRDMRYRVRTEIQKVRLNTQVKHLNFTSQGLGPLLNWAPFSVKSNWNCTPSSLKGCAALRYWSSCFDILVSCCPGPGSGWRNLATPPASKEAESPSTWFYWASKLSGSSIPVIFWRDFSYRPLDDVIPRGLVWAASVSALQVFSCVLCPMLRGSPFIANRLWFSDFGERNKCSSYL